MPVRLRYLFMLLHGCIKFLRQVIGHTWHPGFLFVGPAQTALVLARLLIVLFLGVFAVTL